MVGLARGLALATCTLLGTGLEREARAAAPALPGDWTVDTSWLSYAEADGRVSVSKSMGTLTRTLEDGALSVSLVHDTMSGASPTGGIRSENVAVTYSGPSGGPGFVPGSGDDGSTGRFDDERVQAGVDRDQALSRTLTLSYGAVVSREADYDSLGASIGIARERADRLASVDVGLAYTLDSIYRSAGEDTPEPLAEVGRARRFEAGQRRTVETRLGTSRVLNRRTLAEASVTIGFSEGYHTDPYKVVSAADADDRLIADLHESRPGSRLRTSVQGRIVHRVSDSPDTLRLGYRLYRDDWGIVSHTANLRYRRALSERQFIEPHVRLYLQSAADFLVRKLDVDASLEPILPANGFVSADYRLDDMRTLTLGLKYGVSLGERTDLRVRAEIVDQRFDTVDHDRNRATVLQTSLRHRF